MQALRHADSEHGSLAMGMAHSSVRPSLGAPALPVTGCDCESGDEVEGDREGVSCSSAVSSLVRCGVEPLRPFAAPAEG